MAVLEKLALLLFSISIVLSADSYASKVTFQVDLSYENVSASGVHLFGSMNNWNASNLPMTLSKNTIYTLTIDLNSGTYNYKFINGNTSGNAEIVPVSCSGSNGRLVNISDRDTVIELVNFGSCWHGNSSFLHRKGKNFYRGASQIFLKGVNLGNWLVFEPYMFKSNGSDQHDIINNIRNVVGTAENTQNVVNEFRKYMIQEPDIQAIAEAGFNHVRVPLHYNLFYDTLTSKYIDQGFTYLDSLEKWCTKYDVLIILDMHRAPGSDRQDDQNYIWTQYTSNRELFSTIWQNIANHFKDSPIIGGYDLMNEPTLGGNEGMWKLRDMYVNATKFIRMVDKNHMIIAEGNWWGVYLNDISPAGEKKWDMNLAYSIHNYWSPIPNSNATNQINDASSQNVPLWLGEFGENSNHWYNLQRRFAESKNIGWAYWTWKKMDSDVNTCVKAISTGGFNFIGNYWKNGGSKPSPANAYKWLMDMARQCSFDSCVVMPDVLDALLRSDFHSTPKAYGNHVIPSRIYAVDFDLGANGIAYSDKVFQTISQNPYTAWNDSWKYRNDGVDINSCNDGSKGFCVGGISDGEWLHYTAEASNADYYNLTVRVASPYSTAKFHVEIDKNNVSGSINIPNTGSWTTWRNVVIPCVKIESGIRKMKLVVESAGFDLNWFEFAASSGCSTGIGSKLKNDEPVLIITQPASHILQVSGNGLSGNVQLGLYSLTGKKVFTTLQNLDSQVRINLPDLADGLYIVKAMSDNQIIKCQKVFIGK